MVVVNPEPGQVGPAGGEGIPFNIERYGASTGSADNTAAVNAAIAAAKAAGGLVYFPAGVFPITGNLVDLHSVRRFGPGGISREGHTFYAEAQPGSATNLYAAPAGSPANDGLSPAKPLELQAALTALEFGGLVLKGNWTVNLAAGTYTGTYAAPSVILSNERVKLCGPSVEHPRGIPTAIIDSNNGGTGLDLGHNFMKAEDVFIKGFKGGSASGLLASSAANVWANNVHTEGNEGWAGINFSEADRGYVQGGEHHGGCQYGWRFYNTIFTFGYHSESKEDGPVAAPESGSSAGILVQHSYGDVFGYISKKQRQGIHLTLGSRIRMQRSTFTESVEWDVAAEEGSHVNFEQESAENTFTSPAKALGLFGYSTEIATDAGGKGELSVTRAIFPAEEKTLTGTTVLTEIFGGAIVPFWMVGKKVRVRAWGEFAGAGAKTVGVYHAGQQVSSFVSAGGSTSKWVVDCDLFITGVESEFYSLLAFEGSSPTGKYAQGTRAFPVDGTKAINIRGTLENAAGKIVLHGCEIFFS